MNHLQRLAGAGVLAGIAGLTVVGVAAASGNGTQTPAEVTVQATGQDLAELTHPSSPPRAAHDRQLHVALGEALESCANDAGVQYQHPDPPDAFAPITDDSGLIDAVHAQEHGYMPPPDLLAEQERWANPLTTLSTEDQAIVEAAFWGDDPDAGSFDVTNADGQLVGGYTVGNGCIASFYADFYGSWDEFVEMATSETLIEDAWRRASEITITSPEVEAAVQNWSDCMSDAGLGDFGTPTELFEVDWGEERPSPEEITTAVGDVDCKAKTGLTDVLAAVRQATEVRIIAEEGLAPNIEAIQNLLTS